MEFADKGDQLRMDVCSVLEGMGLFLVDFSCKGISTGTYVSCILYKSGGISSEDCARAHRAILPRLEVVLGERDITMEVSSPGIDRNLKHADEFEVFMGKPVRILLQNETEWQSGVIAEASDDAVAITSEKGDIRFPYTDIRKAQLH